MQHSARTTNYVSGRIWSRKRVQLAGGLFFAIGLPLIVLSVLYPNFVSSLAAQYTTLGAAVATILSITLLRNMSVYPGAHRSLMVLPVVLGVYGLTFALFLLFRLDYNRAAMLSAGGGTLTWLYLVQLMIEREPSLRLGLVPFGRVDALSKIASLNVIILRRPRVPLECDMIVADFEADLSDDWEAFLADCALTGLPVFHVKQLLESLTGRVEIEHLSENSFGSLIPFMGYLSARRLFDCAGAVMVGLLLLPFFALIAVAIKVDSPGPVFFRQKRIGYRGQPFNVVKFRTMIVRHEEDPRLGAMTQINDARITRVGRFLRRSRLDELGQIWNVIRGEMSWIGPRPEAEELSRWYQQEIPFYRYRHIVPPGITGWAQVNQGHVVEIGDVTNKLHYDFYYIKHFSPWLDALVGVKTVQTIVTGFGSK